MGKEVFWKQNNCGHPFLKNRAKYVNRRNVPGILVRFELKNHAKLPLGFTTALQSTSNVSCSFGLTPAPVTSLEAVDLDTASCTGDLDLLGSSSHAGVKVVSDLEVTLVLL